MKTRTAASLLIGTAIAGIWFTGCAATGGGGSGSRPKVAATKEQPFVNSLGMKFVPVPGTKILMCTTETTVAQYKSAGMGYQALPFPQGPTHPAVNLGQLDAKTWCEWLSKKEGKRYRLPTEAEWSAAVGRGTYPWGESWPPPNNAGNFAGQELRGCTEAERAMLYKGFQLIGGFSDRHKFTAPVGSYAANGLGIYDLGGNVSEWCEDPHVMRGSSWSDCFNFSLKSSQRICFPPELVPYSASPTSGFRCVLER